MVRLTPDGTNPPRLESVITTTTRRRSLKKKRRRILPRADINVTPFIDILLVLLVIFMTISPTDRTGVNAAVPQLPPPGPRTQREEKVIVLSMDRNGVIKINQDEIEPSRMMERLQDIFKPGMIARFLFRPTMNH